MIIPLCYYEYPHENGNRQFVDPIGDKIFNIIHSTRIDLFFNRARFSLDDVLERKYEPSIIKQVDELLNEIQYISGVDKRMVSKFNPLVSVVKTATLITLRQKYKIKGKN